MEVIQVNVSKKKTKPPICSCEWFGYIRKVEWCELFIPN